MHCLLCRPAKPIQRGRVTVVKGPSGVPGICEEKSAREGGVTAERCNKAIKVWNGEARQCTRSVRRVREKGKGSVWGFPIYITKTDVDVRGLRENCLNLRRL